MRLHTLVLEGDKKAEKDKSHSPAYTKNDYLRHKWIESRPPLRNRSFYLCRMIEEELRGIDIDGSGKITICAHQIHMVPGEGKYICDRDFKISAYYLEQGQIDAIGEATRDTESKVIAGILLDSLLDIAHRNNCSADVIEKIEGAFERIINDHFVREERISKLTKQSKSTGLTAHVYRILSDEVGEGWYVKITNRKRQVLCQEVIGNNTRYVDRLGSQLYAKAEWRGDTFVILERFGKEVFSISVPS